MDRRQVEVIYCDDIRQEVSGKLTLVGVYSNILYAQAIPIVLPKLCIIARLVSPIDQPASSFGVRIFSDDEILKEWSPEDIDLPLDGSEDVESDSTCWIYQAFLTFSPLPVDKPCTIRIEIDVDSETIEGLPLKIRHPPPKENSDNSQ